MIFQSTTAESIGHPGNNDPKPQVGKNSGERYGAVHPGGVRWEPRPEFDRPPVNPILGRFRDGDLDVDWYLWEYNHETDSWIWSEPISADAAIHAHRVLSRLAALTEEK